MQDLIQSMIEKWPQLANILDLAKFSFLVYAIGLIVEYFRPAEKNQPSEDIRFNVIYTLFFITMNTLVFAVFIKIKQPVVEFIGGPYFTFHFGASRLQQILHALTFLFIFDFFYYWFHRWQHTLKVFWAQHQFHHADPSLNITTSSRHHWLEDSLRIFIILIPMSILFGFKAEAVGWIWSTFMLWGFFIHLNIKLNLGFLTGVFGGPQLHRIHHSNLKPHLDKNFAAFFPIFDILFGTFYYPKKDEYPTTGLYGGPDMNNLKAANLYPFIYWYKQIKKKFK